MSLSRSIHFGKAATVSLITLVVSAVYLFSFPSPTIFYAAITLLHSLLGAVVAVVLFPVMWRRFHGWTVWQRMFWLLFAAGGVVGLVLLYTGTPRNRWNILYTHILLSAVASALLAAYWWASRNKSGVRAGTLVSRSAIALLVLAAVGGAGYYWRNIHWLKINRITNSPAPTTMDGEGDGPRGPFFPSSAQTTDGKLMPGDFFLESESCKRCHQDIYNQWYSSAHHYSSFNNQWYRKSIEYMQDVVGTNPSKWCGGCHDPAVLYTGLMNTPIKEIENRPESQAGLGCVMCHSIKRVKSTMGQADFVLEYPLLDRLATSKQPVIRFLHDLIIRLNPEPHRRVFLKPFMKTQTAEFCSTCHKVHLDVPVNHYRWLRGFDEYDNWQASGISGQGARSFYYPPHSQQCGDCHMPAKLSTDFGNHGVIRAHNFPAANTAVPFANRDTAQLETVEKFLKDAVSVDIFAITPPPPSTTAASVQSQDLATTFAVGEEAESHTVAPGGGEAEPVTAPLNRVNAAVRRGDDVDVDVVVRTRKVGHFFPGGTIDAFDTWVELKAVDDKGQTVFWSGGIADDGKGPVDPSAHFYRSLMVDEHGNPINKRNAWSTRALVYVRLIPPGAADTVHYLVHVPANAGNHIHFTARLRYRKFSWYYTHFSYAGNVEATHDPSKVTSEFDDRPMTFTADTSSVSGELKYVPNLPAVIMAEDNVDVSVLPANAPAPKPEVVLRKDDWTRWNDYGIGLFLQGNLKAARTAFQKIVDIDPTNVDGWTNLGRVAVQEGDMERARTVLQRALQISPRLARANFFYAKVLHNDGRYDDAERRLQTVLDQYPADRVVLNEMARIEFLQRRYGDALQELQKVFAIDPEDLQGHYNAMLCYQGLGQTKNANHERLLYLRFKAYEPSQELTGTYRRLHPYDNNERQLIHVHRSEPLNVASSTRQTGAGAGH